MAPWCVNLGVKRVESQQCPSFFPAPLFDHSRCMYQIVWLQHQHAYFLFEL